MNLTRNINPTHSDISEWVRLPDGKIAHRFDIIGTPIVAYEVYEPYQGHSTMTTYEGQWLGSFTTRPLPPEIEALPGYKHGCWPVERITAVKAYHAALEQESEAIIRVTFPQDFTEKKEQA